MKIKESEEASSFIGKAAKAYEKLDFTKEQKFSFLSKIIANDGKDQKVCFSH